jgi:hypothetical protein
MESAPSFFEPFAQEFEIDLQGMALRPYFQPPGYDGTGGEAATGLWLFCFFVSERRQFNGIRPLLVSELVMMAKLKRWCLE